MRIVRLLCSCLLFLCGISEPTSAQTSYDIEGIIYGPNSRPLEHIVVSLQDQARAQIAQSITTSTRVMRWKAPSE